MKIKFVLTFIRFLSSIAEDPASAFILKIN